MKREIIRASIEHEMSFREHYKLKDEYSNSPEAQDAFEYAAMYKLWPDEMTYIGQIIERK